MFPRANVARLELPRLPSIHPALDARRPLKTGRPTTGAPSRPAQHSASTVTPTGSEVFVGNSG
jgi:hypothetical protein